MIHAHPWRVLYAAAHAVWSAVPLPPGRLRTARAGWRRATTDWVTWARKHRTDAPLLWLHAASAGESQVLQPLVARWRAMSPGVQLIHTVTSPAGRATEIGATAAGYRPPEQRRALMAVLETLRPAGIVVSRGDLWPTMLDAARHRGIPVCVVGAERGSGVRARLATRMLGPLLREMAWIGAVGPADATAWRRAGVPAARIDITGDPRHDHLLGRAAGPVPEALAGWAAGGTVVVAGSTHRPDETVVLDALARLRGARSDLRLLIAPHEPDDGSARRIVARAARRGFTAAVWPDHDPDDAPVVVLNALGHLFATYRLGWAAYVGGGFGGRGIHSLAEPAVHGLPLVVGPRLGRRGEAGRFAAAGGVTRLPARKPVTALSRAWHDWLTDDGARQTAGAAARALVSSGAADTTARAVWERVGR